MKKVLSITFTLLLVLLSKENYAQSTKSWLQLMHDTSANFYDVQKAFYNWYDTQPQKVNPQADEIFKNEEEDNADYIQFKRWEYINAPRVYPTGKFPAIGFTDYQKNMNTQASGNDITQEKSPKAPSVNTWQLLGPSIIPPLSSGYDSTNTSGWSGGGAGRLNMVWNNPLKITTLYAGSGSGGLWRSYNTGKTWTPIGDQLATLGVTDLQCVPNDTNTMYLATGDLDGNAIPSVGLLKSTDNGNTWHATGLNFTLNQGMDLGNILIDPLNVKTLYVASGNGVMKSTDSAHTWITTLSGNYVTDIAMNPGNHSLIYAATFFGGYHYSTNGGATWIQPASLPASGVIREAIGVTPANPAYVYVMAASSAGEGFYGFYQSTDSGKTFTAKFTMAVDSVNLLSWAKTGKGDQYGYPSTGGQGSYDLPIAVNPENPQQVIVGGVDMWETNNGGTTWTDISFWADSAAKPDYAHADIHRIIYLPDTSAVYSGTDGGIFSKSISGVWSDISSGLSIGQIYKLGASLHTNNLVISGWQDNGTSEDNGAGNSWQFVMGSDGSTCVIDWSNDTYQYGSFVGGWIEASTDGGQSFNTISSSITESGGWVTPFVQDPINSQTLYAGYVHVWKTTDRGANWTELTGLPGNSNSIVDLRVATSNNQYIYAATGSDVYVTKNGGTSWSNISSGLPLSSDYCNELCISPTNSDKVWAVFSGFDTNRVYYSSNAGTSWKSISYGLPQYPINCIIYQNGTNDGIYVGTDIGGVYYRDSTNGWVSYSAGLPNVRISDFQMNYVSNQIIAATYGRSIWECNFASPLAVNTITQQKDCGLNVYPNPNNGDFTVNFNADNNSQYLLEITNVLGQIVYQRNISDASGEFTANLNLIGYGKGVYMVVLKQGQQQQSIKKVIVE